MFDFAHNNKKIVQIILGVVILPFAFFGVDSYVRSIDSSDAVATVGGQDISQQEFALALQQRKDALLRMSGGRMNPDMLDSPDLRASVIDEIIRQRLLLGDAIHNGIVIADRDLQEFIRSQPPFQEDGKFSPKQYADFVAAQGSTAVVFEAGMRRDLMQQRLSDGYSNTVIVPNAVAAQLLRTLTQQREISQSVLEPQQFASQVKLDANAAKQYYDAHAAEFQVPQQAKLEYLVLALDTLANQVNVSADEVKQYYQANQNQYGQSEERQASHILIAVDAKASAEEKQAARAKAEQLLKQVKQNPASFADVARKSSQDPDSASKGGDLGFFKRGMMVQQFSDAVFDMKPGEIRGPVESQYGYHIIKLTAVKGEDAGAMQRAELDLKRQKASKQFSELGEQFHNLAFEQSESLKPAADALKQQIRTSGWLTPTGGGDDKLLNNPQLMQAVFSEDTLKNKRNTDVIDVGNNTLISARVVDYKPASTRSFDEVSAQISQRLIQEQATQLAAKRGRELLAKLKQGESESVNWTAPKLVSRQNPQGLDAPTLGEAFKADTGKLPTYAGIEGAKGEYVLLKVTRVVNGDAVDADKQKSLNTQLQQMLGQEEFNAYIDGLKLKANVKLNQTELEKKQ